MSLLFDVRGNLYPATIIDMSIAEVEKQLVSPFSLSSSRYGLFEEYKRYTNDLSNLVRRPFYQWLGGSFVSNSHSPDDIDLVSFIDYEGYHEKETEIDERFSKWSVGRYYPNIDAYTVWTYPTEHTYSLTFQADCAYWYDWFAHTRYNRRRQRLTKGFIRIPIN